MNRTHAIVGIVSGIIGGLIVGAVVILAVNSQNTHMMQMMGMHAEPTSTGMTMEEMVGDLQGKSGDSFDRAFLSGMIEHHEGAIEMARLAATSAKHQELKDMADAILSAQSQEVNQMQAWQTAWGYKQTPMSQ